MNLEKGGHRKSDHSESTLSRDLETVIRFIAASLVLALIVGIAFHEFSINQTSDFTQFYAAAQMVRQGLGFRLYDLATQMEFQSRVAQVRVFYNHPPFETLLFLPFTYVSYRGAYILWTIASCFLLGLAVLLIQSQCDLGASILQVANVRADPGFIIAIFLTFAPATTCLLLGQDSMVMLVVYTTVFVLLNRGSDFKAGCGLAFGLFKLHLVLPFVFILFLRRKWAALSGFSLSGLFLVMVSLRISGLGALVGYPHLLLFDKTYQKIGGFAPEYMPNIRGLIFFVSGGKLPGVASALLIAAGSLLAIWYAANNWKDDQFPLSFAASVLATLLSSYHLYNYDLTLLLLPIAILFDEMVRRRLPLLKSVTGIAFVALFVPSLHRLLLLHGAYALMAVPVTILLITAVKLSKEIDSSRLQPVLSPMV